MLSSRWARFDYRPITDIDNLLFLQGCKKLIGLVLGIRVIGIDKFFDLYHIFTSP
jgi:hypothetical protein